MRLMNLVEEDILAITALCCKVLERAVLIDSMLLAQLLPELAADCVVLVPNVLVGSEEHAAVAALPNLYGYDFSARGQSLRSTHRARRGDSPWHLEQIGGLSCGFDLRDCIYAFQEGRSGRALRYA